MTRSRWVPVHLPVDATFGLRAESIPVIGEGPVEPFFFQSVERWLERPASLLFRVDEPLAELVARARSAPPIRVAGIVAHLSYCGSTLIAQALARLPGVVVLGEPATLDRALRFGAPVIDLAARVELVRALVIATAMPFLPEGGAVVLKPEAVHTAYLPLLRAAFPEATWVFAHRALHRVVGSNLRNQGPALQPGAVDPTLFGLPAQAAETLTAPDYAAALVAGIARAALAHDALDPGLFVDHAALDAATIERIARHFGLPLDAAARTHIAERLRHDAKQPARRYVVDEAPTAVALSSEVGAYVDDVERALRERTYRADDLPDLPNDERHAAARAHVVALAHFAAARFDAGGRTSVLEALRCAVTLHRDQKRPDGRPYLEHVTSVARRVAHWVPSASPELLAAALLHDAVEDQAAQLAADVADEARSERERALAALELRFGPRVRALVALLSNPESMDAGNAAYLAHFEEVFTTDHEAGLIKFADFADNALRVHGIRASHPERYARLVRKYRPCVAFLRTHLRTIDADNALHATRKERLSELEAAWERDYGAD